MTDWRQGVVSRKTQWNETHFSLAIDVDGPAFTAGQFVRIGLEGDGEILGRPYSLVNAPGQPRYEIFFNIVPEGPLSSRLAALEAGDPIWMTAKASGLLTVDQVPADARDLWLLATGTGVGPFLSILQTGQPWDRFDRIVLGYGVRWQRNQAYTDLIADLKRTHEDQFRFVSCITGETAPGCLAGRIPATIASGELEAAVGCDIDPDRSHVMLCGHSGMISDVVELLGARGLRRHRRIEPGHITTEKYH
jgi:ferredoxin/flavodoxin---NADP+ reductase